jgi:hypothetical protein
MSDDCPDPPCCRVYRSATGCALCARLLLDEWCGLCRVDGPLRVVGFSVMTVGRILGLGWERLG